MSRNEQGSPRPETARTDYPDVPDEVLESWQHIVDALTARLNAPVGLVMRIVGSDIETLRAGGPEASRHPVGWRENLIRSGLYCEQVLRTGMPLGVRDARADAAWSGNPSLRSHGLCAYLGYPIRWPDGALFGTICVMDTGARTFSATEHEVTTLLRDLIETNLRSFWVG